VTYIRKTIATALVDRMYPSIGGSSPPAPRSCVREYSALKPRNRPSRGFSSSLVCSTVRQLSKSRRCFGNSGVVFSTTYDWRLNCHLSDASCDCDEEPDAEDHQKANGEVVFKVSGQLNAENVAEIGTLIQAEKKGSRIVLDLTDLRSVHGEAVKFLEKWEADSIKLNNCGLYIREWIRRERLERESNESSER